MRYTKRSSSVSGGGAVDSVFGRTGVVVAATDDYTWAQIDKTVSSIADINLRSHTLLTDIGTNTHAQIDTHIANTSNPHSVTAAQAGAVALTGNENVGGIKTFNTAYPKGPGTAPTLGVELVDKTYVDTFAQGVTFKAACRVATTTAGTLATSFENGDTIDGVVLVTGDRILIKDQASAVENGIYTVNASGAPTRATDFDTDAEVFSGATVTILFGTVNANSLWVQTQEDPVVGTDPILFTQLPAPDPITASNGVKRVGDDLQIDLSDTNPSLEIADGGLRAKVDGTTVTRTASGLAVGTITDSNISGAIGVAHGGSGLTALGTANQVLGVNSGASASEYKSIVAGANVTVTHSAGEIEIAASISGSTAYLYKVIPFLSHPGTSLTLTNLAAATTAVTAAQVKVDLTGALQYRIVAYQQVAGFAGSDINLQYSTNGTTWFAADTAAGGELDIGTGTGLKVGAFTDFVSGAKADVWLRMVTKDGDGIVDPQLRQLYIEVKENSTVTDGADGGTTYTQLTVHSHPASALTWTNMPAAATEFLGTTFGRLKANLSNATEYRIVINQSVAGFAGSDLNLQYSTNNSAFQAADTAGAGEVDCGTGTGVKVGSWAPLVSGAKGDVWLRLVGKDGNGVVDPAWREVVIQFKQVGASGDVVGPSSSTDNAIARFDTTTGKLLQNSGVTIDDSNNVSVPASIILQDLPNDSTHQDYKIYSSGDALTMQAQSSGHQSAWGLWTKDGDGTDNIYSTIFAKGLPGAITDSESLLIGYIASSTSYQISSSASGTGTVRPIEMYTQGNYHQFDLNTDNTIGLLGAYNLIEVGITGDLVGKALGFINQNTTDDISAVGVISSNQPDQSVYMVALGKGDVPFQEDEEVNGVLIGWVPDTGNPGYGLAALSSISETDYLTPLALVADGLDSDPGALIMLRPEGNITMSAQDGGSDTDFYLNLANHTYALGDNIINDIDLTALAGIIARPMLTINPIIANDLGNGIIAFPIRLERYSSDTTLNHLVITAAGGTKSSPVALEDDQEIGGITTLYYDGSDYQFGGQLVWSIPALPDTGVSSTWSNGGGGITLNGDGTVTLNNCKISTVDGTSVVADGTYTVGNRITPVTGDLGTITVKGGMITAVQQAT